MTAPAIKPIMKYPGAKWSSASWIAQHLPRSIQYAEPFCGSAAVYLNLSWKPKHAVLNDLSGDITNLLRVIRANRDALIEAVALTPWSREEYEQSYEATHDVVERARRFLVRTWQANSADISKRVGWRNIGTMANASTVAVWRQLPARIALVADVLLDAEIENVPALEIIERYSQPHALLYVDPPYLLSTRAGTLYQHEMTEADHIELLEALDKHAGAVVLSGYHSTLYDERLKHWQVVETQIAAEKGNTRTEVLWLNTKAASVQQVRMF